MYTIHHTSADVLDFTSEFQCRTHALGERQPEVGSAFSTPSRRFFTFTIPVISLLSLMARTNLNPSREFGDSANYDTYSAHFDLRKELSGGHKFMKWILVLINVIFLVFSIVLIAVGGSAYSGALNAIAGQSIPEGLIVVGVFILLLALLGFFSAYKEWRIGLGIYFVLIAIMTLILLAIGIVVFAKRNDANLYIAEGWAASDWSVRANLQNLYKCCGLTSYNDTFTTDPNYVWPQSTPTCPVMSNDQFYPPCTTNSTVCAPPCLPLMSASFTSAFGTAGSVGIAFAIVMFLCLVFIGLLMRGIKITRYAKELEATREMNAASQQEQARNYGMRLPENVI